MFLFASVPLILYLETFWHMKILFFLLPGRGSLDPMVNVLTPRLPLVYAVRLEGERSWGFVTKIDAAGGEREEERWDALGKEKGSEGGGGYPS